MLKRIPAELQALNQWICWRLITVEGRMTKVPYCPTTGKMASVTDPTTWASFETALSASSQYSGIGLVLTREAGYTIIDLDNKPEHPCTPEQLSRHTKIYNAFDSYAELSTSGTGCHIVVKGVLPSGVHRDNVEAYCEGRYMVCTGNILRDQPIKDYQPLLDVLYGEMRPYVIHGLDEVDESISDSELLSMAMRAANAEKFNALCSGDMSEYPSQSEADFALLSILAFYSQSNEQVRRLFRMSELGKRDKAVRNDTYLNFALGKIRGNQPAPVDLSIIAANAEAIMKGKQDAPYETTTPSPAQPMPELPEQAEGHYQDSDKAVPPKAHIKGVSLPPGLIGELAQYFYQTAIRPVPEIALVAAVALVAGVCGRSYNISGSGLNQYIILLAKTGSGKEGALSGIENLISAVRPQIPMVDNFLGPAAFASGQALVKVLNEKPCFVSVLGEFGLTLQQLSDHRANSAQLMLRKVLLDLYAKSGWNRMLRSSVYSDTEKNTKLIQAPNVSILGESTPETFFDGLDASHIAEGLIPRFSVVEYSGHRPARNRQSNQPPNKDLAQRFTDLVATSLTTSNNNQCIQVQADRDAQVLLDDFDTRADHIMNSSHAEVEVQVWNRAHLKVLKLAALLAVGCNPHQPVINAEHAQWAIDFVVTDVELVAARFRSGDVGQGDSKQFHDLKRAIVGYFSQPPAIVKTRFSVLHKARIIPYAFLLQRTANISSFKNDRLGATQALRKNLQAMIDSGMVVEIASPDLFKKYRFSGVAYGISEHWE